MKVDTSLRWRLRVVDDPEFIDWQAQYTGFDPALMLPEQIDEDFAREFLLAYARFEDKVDELSAGKKGESSANQLYQFLQATEKTRPSNSLGGLIKRASFNTGLIGHSRQQLLQSSYVTDYLFEQSDAFKALLPSTPRSFGDMKAQRRTQREEEEAVKAPYEKQSNETWEGYVQRFLESCQNDPQLSAHGFMQRLAERIKPQYLEPSLLYIKQTIDELADMCDLLNAPTQQRDYVSTLRKAYNASGLNKPVEQMKRFARSAEDKQERTVVYLEKPSGTASHITHVGGVIKANASVISFDPYIK